MSHWYYHKNLKPQGPVDFDEMKRKVLRGEIGPTDLVMKEEEAWRPAAEWREFSSELFPAYQKNYFKESRPEEKEWILLTLKVEHPRGQQEGPYSLEDLHKMLSSHEITPEDYVWRSGLTGWVQIKDRAEFSPPPSSAEL